MHFSLAEYYTHLVNHHNSQQVAEGGKEEAVQVMLDIIANGVAESVQHHLSNDEDKHTEGDVSQGPAVVKRICDE